MGNYPSEYDGVDCTACGTSLEGLKSFDDLCQRVYPIWGKCHNFMNGKYYRPLGKNKNYMCPSCFFKPIQEQNEQKREKEERKKRFLNLEFARKRLLKEQENAEEQRRLHRQELERKQREEQAHERQTLENRRKISVIEKERIKYIETQHMINKHQYMIQTQLQQVRYQNELQEPKKNKRRRQYDMQKLPVKIGEVEFLHVPEVDKDVGLWHFNGYNKVKNIINHAMSQETLSPDDLVWFIKYATLYFLESAVNLTPLSSSIQHEVENKAADDVYEFISLFLISPNKDHDVLLMLADTCIQLIFPSMASYRERPMYRPYIYLERLLSTLAEHEPESDMFRITLHYWIILSIPSTTVKDLQADMLAEFRYMVNDENRVSHLIDLYTLLIIFQRNNKEIDEQQGIYLNINKIFFSAYEQLELCRVGLAKRLSWKETRRK